MADANCGSDCRDASGAVGENATMKVEERSIRRVEVWMLEGDSKGVGEQERGRLGFMWGGSHGGAAAIVEMTSDLNIFYTAN